ncbi:cobalamin B12-binding domain-containing protein [Coprothermobacteraceae bacterium]|nr:cobalamin B12-binding domain-containing protein [Coprothermobacteraceae bacterium]
MSLKVIVAKPGLDGHDRQAKIIARTLKDHGYDVVYTGIRQTPSQIAQTALQESADVVILNCLSGAHMELFPETARRVRELGLAPLIIGTGVIPDDDAEELVKMGIDIVFGPGTSPLRVIEAIKTWEQSRI